MAVDFRHSGVWKLKACDEGKLLPIIRQILIPGENILCAYAALRDRLVFTDKRIISVDSQDMMNKKMTVSTMPYRHIQYFSIETAGVGDWFPDSELFLMFANGFTATFNFKSTEDIGTIVQTISRFVLTD